MENLLNVLPLLLARAVGWFCGRIVHRVHRTVGSGEEKRDDDFAEEAKPHKLYWRIAHMRDDIAALVVLFVLMNILLAAILGVLLKPSVAHFIPAGRDLITDVAELLRRAVTFLAEFYKIR